MFISNHLGVIGAGFPDLCNTPTPAGPVPIPYPNVSVSTTSPPLTPYLLMGCAPVATLLETNPVTNGDQAGVALGIVSGMIAGSQRDVVGSLSTFAGGAPVGRLSSVSTHNGFVPNTGGMEVSPGQVRVLAVK